MEFQLQLIGILLVILALLHLGFPKYFRWKEDLATVSLMNRQMMKSHTFFLALILFGIGIMSYTSGEVLITTKLGRHISLFLALFWFLRLLFQLFFYSSRLWKGKTFETSIHIMFCFFWVYLTTIFGWIGFS